MNVTNLLPHVPDIEKEIVGHKLDAIVYGMGPSAWLLPWVDSSILQSVRLWTAHDGKRILPPDDLALIDSPTRTRRLMVGTEALEAVLASRPKRIWVNDWWEEEWDRHLHFSVKSITKPVKFWVWTHTQKNKGQQVPSQWCMGWPTPHCGFISPLACATLAWREGARRIGVIGVDMGPEHMSHGALKHVDSAFVTLAQDAHRKGGCLVNLSPVTYLRKFPSWTPSESSSAPTVSSATSEPKPSSNTASASTAADLTSSSSGCDPGTQDGKSLSTDNPAPGR